MKKELTEMDAANFKDSASCSQLRLSLDNSSVQKFEDQSSRSPESRTIEHTKRQSLNVINDLTRDQSRESLDRRHAYLPEIKIKSRKEDPEK